MLHLTLALRFNSSSLYHHTPNVPAHRLSQNTRSDNVTQVHEPQSTERYAACRQQRYSRHDYALCDHAASDFNQFSLDRLTLFYVASISMLASVRVARMTSPKISRGLLLYYLTLCPALSFPRSVYAMPTNTSVLNIVTPNFLPGLAAPTPPTGFETRLNFNSSIPLNPIQILLCAVEMMSFLANLPWTYTIYNSISMAGQDTTTEIHLDRWPPGSEDSRLQVQYAILGLYQAGVAIAQGSKYTQLEALFYVEGLQVGLLWFRPEPESRQMNPGADHLTSLNSLHPDNGTTMVTADSGYIIDPEDKKFVLTYRMDGVRMKSQDIFTVILDCFTISAVHENADLDAYISAARSASGDTVMSTWTVGEKGNPHMTWGRLKRAVIILWDLLIIGTQKTRKSKFEGFSFEMKYDGKVIGGGRMLKFDADGQSAEGAVLEK